MPLGATMGAPDSVLWSATTRRYIAQHLCIVEWLQLLSVLSSCTHELWKRFINCFPPNGIIGVFMVMVSPLAYGSLYGKVINYVHPIAPV